MKSFRGPNDASFESESRLRAYDALNGLTPAEETLVDRWIRGDSDILDLGVGTGRTVPALSSRARKYLGLDYSAAMVSAASQRFAHLDFVQGDAADLSRFADASFDAVIFSYNGLDYLAPYDRRARALAEIHRVLRQDGMFIMSTHNPRALVRHAANNRANIRTIAISVAMTAQAVWARGFAAVTLSGFGYHTDHVQGLHTYFATPERLAEELTRVGFVVVDSVGSDHPKPLRALRTPWTYVAAMPRPADLSVIAAPFPPEGSTLADTWDRLVRDVGTGPFQTRQWVSAWLAALEPRAKVEILVARTGAQVVGLLPISHIARPLHRSLRLPLNYVGVAGGGSGAADHLGPITSNPAIASALFEALLKRAHRSTVLLENLDPRWGTVATASIRGRIVRRTPCPANTRAPDGRFEDAWSPKARKNARRRSRKMVQAGITVRWTGPGPHFSKALRELRALHSERWRAKGQPGLFPAKREVLLEKYAASAVAVNGPWILTFLRDESPVAALLGFRFGDSFSVYKTGWSPDVAKLGPGMALGQEAMRWAEEQGLHTFDYLRGPGPHKAELGCRPREDVSVIRVRGITGQLINLREQSDHSIRRAVRRFY